MKRIFSTILLLTGLIAFAQQKEGYEIKVTFKPFKNQFIYLGYYYGKQFPIIDSVKLDDKSEGVFKGDKNLGGGIYLIGYPDKAHFFEMLIDKEQHFSIIADTATLDKGIVFQHSAGNTLFNNYQQYMGLKGKDIEAAKKKLALSKVHKDSLKWEAAISKDNKEIKEYRETLMQKNPNSFLTTLLTAMREPEIPTAKNQPGGKFDSLYAYRYYKNHYWDGVNFYDDRLTRTTFFEPKLDKYFDQLVYPDPDSVNREIDRMLGYASISPDMQKFLLLKFANRYINQKYMWEDKVFVHLFEKYFSNQKYPWLTESAEKTIADRAYNLMANILGTYAANVELPDTSGNKISLYATQAHYTLVCFWDPTCSHCRETLPKIDSIYQSKWKKLGLKIFAIGRETDGTRADWIRFIHRHHIQEWTNVYYSKEEGNRLIAENKPGYMQLYDVQIFPTLYLLDSEKRIIAKKLSYEQMDEVLKQKTNR